MLNLLRELLLSFLGIDHSRLSSCEFELLDLIVFHNRKGVVHATEFIFLFFLQSLLLFCACVLSFANTNKDKLKLYSNKNSKY